MDFNVERDKNTEETIAFVVITFLSLIIMSVKISYLEIFMTLMCATCLHQMHNQIL